MPETLSKAPEMHPVTASPAKVNGCRAVVIWIDWYAYHIARFRGLESAPTLSGMVSGVELVGGVGVHAGLKFREELPTDLPVQSILPSGDWRRASKWLLARETWKRLSKLKPEIVLVPGYYTLPALTAALWAKVHRRTSVLMTESTAEDHQRTGWKEGLKSRLIRGLFDWAVTGGQAHVRYLRQLGFPSDRIVHFYDVVDNRFYREGTALLRRQSPSAFDLPEHYFLYVGRLASEKNVDGLLEGWLKYREAGGTWSLVLAGDGPEAVALRQMVAASAHANEVYFVGHKASRELLPFYAFASCFVLPSKREPWGLVVNEAMASGLPVIVSKLSGCAEDLVSTEENGFRFDPMGQELPVLFSRMEMLSAVQRREMGDHSSAIIADYTPENFGLEIAYIAEQSTRGRSVNG